MTLNSIFNFFKKGNAARRAHFSAVTLWFVVLCLWVVTALSAIAFAGWVFDRLSNPPEIEEVILPQVNSINQKELEEVISEIEEHQRRYEAAMQPGGLPSDPSR